MGRVVFPDPKGLCNHMSAKGHGLSRIRLRTRSMYLFSCDRMKRIPSTFKPPYSELGRYRRKMKLFSADRGARRTEIVYGPTNFNFTENIN